MKKAKIMLGSINDVKVFVNLVNRFDFEVDLVSGRYAVDAKSIMGIFSLDLSKSIEMVVHDDGPQAEQFLTEVAPYIVD